MGEMSRVTIAIIEAFGKRRSGIFILLSFYLPLFVTEIEKRGIG